MPTAFTGNKRSRAVKRRKERETRRVIRSLMGENEFSASYAEIAIQQSGLKPKCVSDIGQFLKDQAKSKVWVSCTKSNGTPRYKIIHGGIESLEDLKDNIREPMRTSPLTVEQRIDNLKSPAEVIETNNFSKVAKNLTTFVEYFGSVLVEDSAITVTQAKEILRIMCKLPELRSNIAGRMLRGLTTPSRYRPALLELCGTNGSGEGMVTLTAVGRNVAKGTWALRDTGRGVRVFNFATGCYLDGQKPETRKKEPTAEPFNTPRLSVVTGDGQSSTQKSLDGCPESPSESGSKFTESPSESESKFTDVPRMVSTPNSDFYIHRASQRLWDVLVTECHPADYEKVIEALVTKLTGTKTVASAKLVSS